MKKHTDSSYEFRDLIAIISPISRDLHIKLSELVKKNKKNKNCTLFLITFGGDADAAYRIGRCLLHSYENVRLVVPWYCKSAGTLVCMAAHQLAISDLGELGPLDVQLLRKDEVGDRSSGLDLIEAMGLISNQITNSFRENLLSIKNETRLSTKLAGDFAVRIATSIIEPLYSQIDPLRLGESQRATAIALQYGQRLSAKTNSISQESLLKLITGYPSHGFVIDRGEAKGLFNNVCTPTNSEELICDMLRKRGLSLPLIEFLEIPTPSPNGHEQQRNHPSNDQSEGSEHAEDQQSGSEKLADECRPTSNERPAEPDSTSDLSRPEN